MKRKYSVNLIGYLTKDFIVIGIFVLAVICGSIYALYIKDRDSTVFLMLNSYMTLDIKEAFEMKRFLMGVYGYVKQLLLIWLFGYFSFTLPLSMLALFIMIFSYSFTTTCILLVYGLKGILIALLVYGVQAVMMITIGVCLEIVSLRKYGGKKYTHFNECVAEIMLIVAGSCVISVIDMFIMANVHGITNGIL